MLSTIEHKQNKGCFGSKATRLCRIYASVQASLWMTCISARHATEDCYGEFNLEGNALYYKVHSWMLRTKLLSYCQNNTEPGDVHAVSVSAQDGIAALRKAHTCSAPSLSSLPKVALKTVPFVWFNTDRSRPWRVECRPLPFSIPLSFRRSVLWRPGLSMLRKFLKPLSISALPSCRSDMISAVLASLSARSFPLTLTTYIFWPGNSA